MSAGLPPGVAVDGFVTSCLGRPAWRMAGDREWRPGEAVAAAREASVGLVSCRIDAGDRERADELVEAGFRPVGRLVTFSLALDASSLGAPADGVRVGRAADVAACREIARTSFVTDRFHADPEIPDAMADNLKAAWVENAFAGRADHILVCDRAGEVVGFDLCFWRPPVAVIDLIAVAVDVRGGGIAAAMIANMARAAAEIGLQVIEAGTQENNAPACSLYRRLGFLPIATRIDFHWTPGSR